jgi:hypothetical protein
MRFLPLLLAAGVIGSCTAGPAPNTTSLTPREQAKLATLTAGKVAGRPMSCLPAYYTNEMTTIEDRAVAFKRGQRVYLNNMQGSCVNLREHYTLVTRHFGSGDLCRGDIAQIVDLPTGMTVGSCVFGDFVPYAPPGYRY